MQVAANSCMPKADVGEGKRKGIELSGNQCLKRKRNERNKKHREAHHMRKKQQNDIEPIGVSQIVDDA